ncbi:MAG TPA: arsenate reductase ArsC [Bacteroidia bacterium]|jgi:arsenate reductase|nr:arsenate reductase ArsC [Bacteroidia bacterium]
MKKVLFVCIHNSARSQMAEAYLNHLGKNKFIAESAGIEGGHLNPLVVEAMRLDGIDISGNKTKTVDEILKARKQFDLVVTVCDEASAERCPVFPGKGKKLHWGFPDPSTFSGTKEEKLEKVIAVRNEIRTKIEWFVNTEDSV